MPSLVSEYRDAVKRNPTLAEAHRSLGFALAGVNGLAEAAQCFRKAVELDPDDAGAHYGLGAVEKLRGNYDAALHHLEAAITLEPERSAAHYELRTLIEDLERGNAPGRR